MSAGLFDAPVLVAPALAGRYKTIYADPPWLERGGGKIKRGADRHYDLMRTEEIMALPVSRWAASDAHLYLWVTNAFLEDGLKVVRAWGFRYVTKIDWFKGAGDDDQLDQALQAPLRRVHAADAAADAADRDLQIGLGQYFRGCTESCLFAVRGSLPYRLAPSGKRAQGRTGFHAPRGQHSAKPEKHRRTIEQVSHGPYLELFARRPAPGWDTWGHEAPVEASA